MASPSTGNGAEPTMYEKQLSNAPSIGYTAQARRLGDVYESDARLDRSHPAAAVDTGNIQDAHWRRCEGQQSWPLMSWSLPSQGDPEHEDVEVEGYKVSLRALPMGERQQTAPGPTADERMMYENWDVQRKEQQQPGYATEPDGDRNDALDVSRQGTQDAAVLLQKMNPVDSSEVSITDMTETHGSTENQLRQRVKAVTELYSGGKHVKIHASSAEGTSGGNVNQGRTLVNKIKQPALPENPIPRGQSYCHKSTLVRKTDRTVLSETKNFATKEGMSFVSALPSSGQKTRRHDEVQNYEKRGQSNGSDHGYSTAKTDGEIHEEVPRGLLPTDAAGKESGTVTIESNKVLLEEIKKTILIDGITGCATGHQKSKSDIAVLEETKKPMVQSGLVIPNAQAPQTKQDKLKVLAETKGIVNNSEWKHANETRVDTQKDSTTPFSYRNPIRPSNVSGVEKSDRQTTVQSSQSDGFEKQGPTRIGAEQPSQRLETRDQIKSKQVVSIQGVADTLDSVKSTRLKALSDTKPKLRVFSGAEFMSA